MKKKEIVVEQVEPLSEEERGLLARQEARIGELHSAPGVEAWTKIVHRLEQDGLTIPTAKTVRRAVLDVSPRALTRSFSTVSAKRIHSLSGHPSEVAYYLSTDLGSRILATGVPVARIAAEAVPRVTRGHLSNAMYGRRNLSPEAKDGVEDVLRRLEGEREREGLKTRLGASLISAMGQRVIAVTRETLLAPIVKEERRNA